jgi:hypothetical protein
MLPLQSAAAFAWNRLFIAPFFRLLQGECRMTKTITLTDHDAIRDWAAGRAGAPAVVDISPAAGSQPMLRIVFGQHAYQDQNRPERPVNAGGYDLVEWDEWFKLFDERELALVVSEEVPGVRDEFHELVRRSSADK